MEPHSRRQILKIAAQGLAVAGASALILRPEAEPTRVPLTPLDHGLDDDARLDLKVPVTHSIRAPYYRAGAPFRGKLGLPMDEGKPLVVAGRVWAYDTKRPLAHALLEVFQVDSQGVYAMKDGDFRNRARVRANEAGLYEIESLHPVGYFLRDETGKKERWRRPHIHFEVRAPGYKVLATELYFEGDKTTNEGMFDDWAHESLVMSIHEERGRTGPFEAVRFDLVLAPGAGYAT